MKERLGHRRRPPHPLPKLCFLRDAWFRFPQFQPGVYESWNDDDRMFWFRAVVLVVNLPRDDQVLGRIIIQI